MVLRQVALIAVGIGAILTGSCLYSLFPDPHAIIQGTQTYDYAHIGDMALCGAPIGVSFIFAVIAAFVDE